MHIELSICMLKFSVNIYVLNFRVNIYDEFKYKSICWKFGSNIYVEFYCQYIRLGVKLQAEIDDIYLYEVSMHMLYEYVC